MSPNATKIGGVFAAVIASLALGQIAEAHFGTSSYTSPLAIVLGVAGLVALIAGGIVSSKGMRRTGLAVFIAGVLVLSLAGADFAFDSGMSQIASPTQVEIVSPKSGTTVATPVEFEIKLTDGTLVPLTQTVGTPTEGHLHIYVDSQLVDMAVSDRPTLDIPDGKHIVQVEFTGADHKSFNPPITSTSEFTVGGSKRSDTPSPNPSTTVVSP